MFKIIYFTGLIIMFIFRLFYRWRSKTNQIVDSRKTALEILLLFLAFVGMLVTPLIYVFTPLLSFADYQLPSWTGWDGLELWSSL